MQFKQSEFIQRTAKELVVNCVDTLQRIKHVHEYNIKDPKPYKEDSLSFGMENPYMNV